MPRRCLDAVVPGIRRCGSLIALLRVALVGLVASDDASGDRTYFAVACHMASETTNHSTLDASFRFGGRRRESYAEKGGTKDQ
jgi:hypothetical protein